MRFPQNIATNFPRTKEQDIFFRNIFDVLNNVLHRGKGHGGGTGRNFGFGFNAFTRLDDCVDETFRKSIDQPSFLER